MKKEVKNLQNQVYIYSIPTNALFSDREVAIHKAKSEEKELVKQLKDERDKKLKLATNERVKELNEALHNEFDKHEGKRVLRKEFIKDVHLISLFDSNLTRTLGMEINAASMDVITIRTYHQAILEDLIHNGFTYYDKQNDEHIDYQYFTSSAGGIREKKSMWIRKDKWQQHKDTLTCGLDKTDINRKNGMITNKYQSYLAMNATASVEWTDFNIDQVVVVDDLEMMVTGKVDYIDKDTYEITPNVEKTLPMEINDGVGLILPELSEKNFQYRAPWQKGLLASYDFLKQAKMYGNTKITDIYGDTYDIVDDNIKIILTKSQFKAHLYYNNWNDYKAKFKKYDCKASIVNVEDDEFNDGLLNYQFIQTLTDVSGSELEEIVAETVEAIELMGNDQQTMLESLGVTDDKKHLNSLQQALKIYPELLNDTYSREIIKNKRRSMIKQAKAGKLKVASRYTYILPDLYEFVSWLFTGELKPLLKEDEVYCNLYDSGKVSIARSPHLSREHGIKMNVIDEAKSEWFTTNAIYISNHSFLPRLLQCDFDGDMVNVFEPNSKFVEIAERNMTNDNIIPIYYEEPTAETSQITNENIFNNLINSYKVSIGEKSNEITRFWNGDYSNLDVVKWLTFENNLMIDYAKNLWLPKRPDHVDKIIKESIQGKVPRFFQYAKNKKIKDVAPINNSTVNRINELIPTNNIKLEDVNGVFDYRMLMSNPKASINKNIVSAYTELDRNKTWRMNSEQSQGKPYVYQAIRNELLAINKDSYKVADVLIKYLYENKNSEFKTTLWECFGKEIIYNLKQNVGNTNQCSHCHARIKSVTNKKYCSDCAEKAKRGKLKAS
ncbi:hypothetical protein [Oceanobacillus sp. J11TS1]|uniref:hypothetical protein n=1 Tax=Oceanobacillus sp. J11TS1 TaxID=2807191 RepID=UPI001B1CE342|nr:hypothetical protein [Oceanobacillus sp. J11TS1]GIO22493.1 hypothetical protein J11TS1_10740 [Oceanobacillus sp. J11TS1]